MRENYTVQCIADSSVQLKNFVYFGDDKDQQWTSSLKPKATLDLVYKCAATTLYAKPPAELKTHIDALGQATHVGLIVDNCFDTSSV